ADDVEGIEARVHDLPPREQVSSWAVTEEQDERGECENDREIPARTALRPVRGQREDASERRVIEGRDRERDGDKVQPGEISRDDGPRLRRHDHDPRERRNRLRKEQEPRDDELGEVIAEHSIRWRRFGRRWKYQLSGLGIG